jgi:hypothetical protein
MRQATEHAIRASFVNCTKGEAKRLNLPPDLATLPWDDLDFLGWRDPAAPQRAYLATEVGEPLVGGALAGRALVGGALVGVVLRVAPQTGRVRRSMCSLCLTTHTGDGVSLMTARKAGPDGRLGNSVGLYICTDLACSLYIRGKKSAGRRLDETITLAAKIERTTTRLAAFLQTV